MPYAPQAEKDGKNYVLGKGRVYFDDGTGEDYFGNSPEFSMSTDTDTLDHYDADAGLNVKDESITTQNDLSGSITIDNISMANIARWFGGDLEKTAVAAATGVVESKVARLGRYIQLGEGAATPSGARHVKNVVIKKGSTTIALPGNYEVELDHGRVYIEPDATDIDDLDVLSITFDIEASTRMIIVGKGKELRGSLRYLATNPVGGKTDAYCPLIKLASSGDYAFKGDDWQSMTFDFEVLKRDAQTERIYFDRVNVQV